MNYVTSIAPGQILPQIRREWLTVYIWIACNSRGTDEPFYGKREIKFQIRGGPIRVITEEDLKRFGISDQLYRALAQSTDGRIYLPTTDPVKAGLWVGKLRDLFGTFTGIPARPGALGVKRLYPFENKNIVENGYIVRECHSNLRKMPENDMSLAFIDNEKPDGSSLKGKSYRQLFNENGGQKFVVPPFNPDYRVAADRVQQLRHFRDRRMPLIEELAQAAHSLTVEYKICSLRSVEVGISSKGYIQLVFHRPGESQKERSVMDKGGAVNTLRKYLEDILQRQENLADKAEIES